MRAYVPGRGGDGRRRREPSKGPTKIMPDPLRVIPGVGSSIAEDLRALGIERVSDLVGRDPEELYLRRCTQQGVHIDRCLLYVFRCAVYFAEQADPEPELLLWWNWKDAADPPLGRLRASGRRGRRA